MNKLFWIFTLGLSLMSQAVLAEDPPLKVAIKPYSPPFVFQAGNKQLFGFDVSTANYLCNALHRTCVFVQMPFSQILSAVQSGQVDMGLSAITITAARANRVNFTQPYLMSYTRFIGPKSSSLAPFSLTELNNQTIGIEEGTIFGEEIQLLGILNPRIKQYKDLHELINAVATGDSRYALIDDPGDVYSTYLTANFGDKIAFLGKPILYGAGLGVAVNPREPDLLNQLNSAMSTYLNSPDFIKNYNAFIGQKY